LTRVRVISAAEAELADAARWYKGQSLEAATRFLDEYERLLERLGENPLQFPRLRGELRRAGFRGFPYGLIYRIVLDEVEVM
jgi:toxin ParE1/3/4